MTKSEEFVLSGWRRTRRLPGCEEIGNFLILEGNGGGVDAGHGASTDRAFEDLHGGLADYDQ